jgi:hypothetical protein
MQFVQLTHKCSEKLEAIICNMGDLADEHITEHPQVEGGQRI